MNGIEHFDATLPHGISLSCRAAGAKGRPVMMFLHGFPEAAFVWDELLLHFSLPQQGGYRCIAPNLRGYAGSSAPKSIEAYRPRHLVQDIAALARAVSADPLAAVVAHDWGGALAWNLAAQEPALLRRLVIINSPHPATFARDLAQCPAQQSASAYMNFLARPDAADRLAEDDFRRLWALFEGMGACNGPNPWLDAAMRERYRSIWRAGLHGPCAYYAATALRPPDGLGEKSGTPERSPQTPSSLGRTEVPTQVIWGMQDTALLPKLLDGLDAFVPRLWVERIEDATHWVVHEQAQRVIERITAFMQRSSQYTGP